MIRMDEKNLSLQTSEGVEIIEMETGIRKTLISHKRQFYS